MHFELRRYADGASNLLIKVWDSSASEWRIQRRFIFMEIFLKKIRKIANNQVQKQIEPSTIVNLNPLSINPGSILGYSKYRMYIIF